MGKAHGVEGSKRRANVGAMIHGAAAAVDVDFRVSGKGAGGVLEGLQPLWTGSGPGIDGARNMRAAIEHLKADLQDDRLRAGVLCEQGGQLAGLRRLRCRPWIGSGLLRAGWHCQDARDGQDRGYRVPQGRTSK